MHYSKGMATLLIISDILSDGSKLESYSGVDLTPLGAVATGSSGTLTSAAFSAAQPVLAIRLHTLAQSSVSYEFSIDGGASWHAIRDGYDVFFSAPQRSVQIRAHFSGAGTVLQGLDVTGVYEMNPLRFKVRLLRPVTPFALTGASEFTQAMPAIANDSKAELTTRRLYVDGVQNGDSFTVNLLPYGEGSAHSVTALGLDGSGAVHGSGAQTAILLRGAPNATGTYETGKLTLSGDTYAIRLETLCQDASGKIVTSGNYAYSYDGSTWTDMALNGYVLLPKAVQSLCMRAVLPAGVTLRALHLEGVTATGKSISTALIKAPYNVQAADYGDFYENEKLRRYVLTWTDANQDDASLANEVYFDIYRNGERIAATQSTCYEDYDYVSGAAYHVAARRVYAQPQDGLSSVLERTSNRVGPGRSLSTSPRRIAWRTSSIMSKTLPSPNTSTISTGVSIPSPPLRIRPAMNLRWIRPCWGPTALPTFSTGPLLYVIRAGRSSFTAAGKFQITERNRRYYDHYRNIHYF